MTGRKVVPLEHCVTSVVSASLNSGVLSPWLKWCCAIVSVVLRSDSSALVPERSERFAIFNHITAKQSALLTLLEVRTNVCLCVQLSQCAAWGLFVVQQRTVRTEPGPILLLRERSVVMPLSWMGRAQVYGL